MRSRVIYLASLGVAYILSVWAASTFCLWGDELYSLYYASWPIKSFLLQYFITPDNHPPLYYLLLNAWHHVFGYRLGLEAWDQALSLAFHFLTLGVLSRFWVEGRKQKLWFWGLGLASSYFFMFSHMVRYYSLAAFLAVSFFLAFQYWLLNRTLRRFILAMLLLASVGYTDYPAYGYLMLYVLLRLCQIIQSNLI